MNGLISGVGSKLPKRFPKRVRWEFKVAMHGYGKNCKEALFDAAKRFENDLVDGSLDVQAIEDHEVISIEEKDIEPPESQW